MFVEVDILFGVRGSFGTVEDEGPFVEFSFLWFLGVEDDDELPRSAGVLRPAVGRHERPFGEAVRGVVILGALGQDHERCVHGGDQVQGGVSSSRSLQSNERLDMLQVVHLVFQSFTGISIDGQNERSGAGELIWFDD